MTVGQSGARTRKREPFDLFSEQLLKSPKVEDKQLEFKLQ